MLRHALHALVLLAVLIGSLASAPGARAQSLADWLGKLAAAAQDERLAGVSGLAASGDARAEPLLQALLDGDLYRAKADGRLLIASKGSAALLDALSGDAIEAPASAELDKLKINNRLRGAIRAALGTLRLLNPDRNRRLEAAAAAFKARDKEAAGALRAALAREQDAQVRRGFAEALAAIDLASGDKAAQIAAIRVLSGRGDNEALSLLTTAAAGTDEEVKTLAAAAVRGVESRLALWQIGQTVFYGLSLGSVLLLAAIGLAITFGVMGVLNMAHGEMIMLGAYTTFAVQEVIRTSLPGLFDASLLIALPLAFLIAGGVGILIERGIIRFLYGRPLETLLATWGLSLMLQQAVRSLFGPTNREVGNPSWMSGSFDAGHLVITYNRLWIIVFALGVLVALMLVLRYTSFGLKMRAVTQNRRMAANMGIRTGWVDALTFGLGSGIAGIAGVALSQIDNVSPNLGQSYIIDSFMVVVFGGVGNLWGTLVGAVSLGILNKFLEPMAGAVLGKILVLVLIILFIQKRPRGLFPQKGRAAEA